MIPYLKGCLEASRSKHSEVAVMMLTAQMMVLGSLHGCGRMTPLTWAAQHPNVHTEERLHGAAERLMSKKAEEIAQSRPGNPASLLEVGSCCVAQAGLILLNSNDLPVLTSQIAGIAGMSCHVRP